MEAKRLIVCENLTAWEHVCCLNWWNTTALANSHPLQATRRICNLAAAARQWLVHVRQTQNDPSSRIKDARWPWSSLSQGNVKGVIRPLLSMLMPRRRTAGSWVAESSTHNGSTQKPFRVTLTLSHRIRHWSTAGKWPFSQGSVRSFISMLARTSLPYSNKQILLQLN